MKKSILIIAMLLCSVSLFAQGPKGRDFGFGVTLGEPTGVSLKFWLNNENALALSLGSSYFGELRLGADYLWHFDAFNSSAVKMYAGPGAVLGFGDGNGWVYKKDDDKFFVRNNDDFGFGARAVVGLNIIPKRSPIEFFLELGVMVGLIPNVGTNGEAAVGIRFYP